MDVMERYARELERRSYAPRTVTAYTSSLKSFVRWLGQPPGRVLPRELLESYLQHCIAEGRSRAYLDLTLSALKVLYVGVFRTPAEQFECARPAAPRRAPRSVPSCSEVFQIADTIPVRSQRLAVLLMYGSGLRLKEVVALQVGDVDCTRGEVRVRDPLTRAERVTILHQALIAEMSKQIRGRAASAPLLPGVRGQPVSPRAIRRAYQQSVRRHDLGRFDSTAVLRAAFASHHLEAGEALPEVQRMLGTTGGARPHGDAAAPGSPPRGAAGGPPSGPAR